MPEEADKPDVPAAAGAPVPFYDYREKMRPAQSAQPVAPDDPDDPLIYPAAPWTLREAVWESRAGRRAPMDAARWGLGDVWIMLSLWIILAFFIGGFAYLAIKPASYATALIVASVLPWFAFAGWPWFTSRWQGNGWVTDFGLRPRASDFGWGVLYGAAAIAVGTGVAAITAALFGSFESNAGEVLDSISSNKPLLAVFLLTVTIGAPICEEIAFRGLAFGAAAKRRLAPWLAVVISAALFAGIHFEPIRFPLLFAVGITFGIARWHTRSTVTSIVAHVTLNTVSSSALIFSLFS